MTEILAKEEPVTAEAVEVTSEPTQYPLEFTGTAEEYFRIWIVNTFLTIITLGIYAAWAKVRTRQYFYAHTRLAGQPFEYLADPKAILRGNLIIGGAFLLYTALGHYNPTLAGIIVILFYLFLPFLIYKTLRFYAHNSAFRNIRFRFLGNLKESYVIYMGLLALMPLTLGLIVPYWFFRQKKYFFEHIGFGTSLNSFDGKPGFFYRTYWEPVRILAYIGIGVYALFGKNYKSISKIIDYYMSYPPTVILMMCLFILIIMVGKIWIQQYIYGQLTNYCWQHSRLGDIRFESTLQVRELIWIRLTNIIAIICSFGIMIPWTKIRYTRYILEQLTVISQGSLDEFTGAATIEDSAIGDAATDIFDIEIGL